MLAYKSMTNEEFDLLVSQECDRKAVATKAKIKDTSELDYMKKSPSEIKKNDIIFLDNKQCKIIDISFSRCIKNQQYLFIATECDTNQKKEKIFSKDDIVYVPN